MVDYYSEIKGYDGLHAIEQQRKLGIVQNLLPDTKDLLILDVGCGTGLSSQLPGTIIGIDPSIGMLKRNPSKLKVCGAAEALPFPDSVFDVVISLTAIHNFADIEKGLAEMQRVGKEMFVFGVLRKSSKAAQILSLIGQHFSVMEQVQEQHDTILFCSRRF